MKFIAHRGNLEGKNTERENHPDYIDEAIEVGFDVEIDVWVVHGEYFLGHDRPEHNVEINWLRQRWAYLWCHAKNLEALDGLRDYHELNTFWHQEDDYVITSHGHIWTYPEKQIIQHSLKQIILLFDYKKEALVIPQGGICSDEVIKYRFKYEHR